MIIIIIIIIIYLFIYFSFVYFFLLWSFRGFRLFQEFRLRLRFRIPTFRVFQLTASPQSAVNGVWHCKLVSFYHTCLFKYVFIPVSSTCNPVTQRVWMWICLWLLLLRSECSERAATYSGFKVAQSSFPIFFNTNSLRDRCYHTVSFVSMKITSNKCPFITQQVLIIFIP